MRIEQWSKRREIEDTMSDDLEMIGLKIANQYVDFIEVFEELKEEVRRQHNEQK